MSTRYQKSGNYSKSKYEEFWKNGFIVLRNLMSHEHCDYSYFLAKSVANKDFAQIMHLHREDFLIAQSSDRLDKIKSLPDKISYIQNISNVANHFDNYLKTPKIVDYLRWLYKSEMVGLLTNIFFKQPSSKYSKQAWLPHQDNSYLDNDNGMYITVNVPFNYMSKKNGGLRLYPGSHNLGNLDFNNKISYREKDGKPGNKIKQKLPMKPVQLMLNKGDVLFMHGLCVHESSNNNSKDPRPLISLGYIPYGEKFDPGFNSKRRITFLK